ncbi:MAG: TetR/AcrR family transcriptional regulator [Pseudomonadota bacterium]|jgi:AcrR family transcriptional regulator
MSNDVEEKAAADRQPKRIVARRPQRKPGQLRFRKLLEALDELLVTSNVQDIGLYQIAAKAKVPNASVYHFFPSTEAALLALAEVHHNALLELSMLPLEVRPARWQDLFRLKVTSAAQYHNNHPAALRLFLGANISLEVKTADISQLHRLVDGRSQLLSYYFHVPSVPDWERRLATYFSMIDGVFSLAYSEHGYIRDDYIAEAHLAGIAYLRCYLPEILVPRDQSEQRAFPDRPGAA